MEPIADELHLLEGDSLEAQVSVEAAGGVEETKAALADSPRIEGKGCIHYRKHDYKSPQEHHIIECVVSTI